MDGREIQQALKDIGWPIVVDGNVGAITRQAVRDFQAGLAFINMTIDGEPGPATQHELRVCLERGGKCGGNFYYREFKSKGNGWIKVDRSLVWWLDRYRERFGPTTIISGYRDPAHNRRVGGATRSQHLAATAADIRPVATVAQVRSLGGFTGIGYNASSGRVSHVDRRPGNPGTPTVWRYGR
jgi:peptidoglycan hydrolase-like protein with peptidoglycan-binding domain